MAIGRVAYILTEFPSRTEIFAAREISALMAMGWQVSVLAATRSLGVTATVNPSAVIYRPRLFSWATVGSLGHMLRRYPLALARLAGLLLQLLLECPRETLVLLRNIPALARFIRHLDAEGIGHVHAYFLGWPACLGLAISRVTGRSLTLAGHARDIFVEAGAVRVKVRQARAVVTCTEQGCRHLKRQLPAWLHDRIHLVRHGLDLASAQVSSPSRSTGGQGAPCILAVARFVPKKGLENLLSALGMLQGQRLPCRLVVVGDGPGRPRFEQLVQDAGLIEHVKILGWLGSGDVAAQMLKASVLAVPSVIATDGDRDGIPNVILEAFACGLPVVASGLEGIAEAVRDGETGLLVPPGNIVELAEALRRILTDGPLRDALVAQGRQWVRCHCDIRTNVGVLAALLQEAMLLRSSS